MICSATYGLKNKITCPLKNLYSFRIQLNQIPSWVLKSKFNHITAMLSVHLDSNFKLRQCKSPLTKPCKEKIKSLCISLSKSNNRDNLLSIKLSKFNSICHLLVNSVKYKIHLLNVSKNKLEICKVRSKNFNFKICKFRMQNLQKCSSCRSWKKRWRSWFPTTQKLERSIAKL